MATLSHLGLVQINRACNNMKHNVLGIGQPVVLSVSIHFAVVAVCRA